MEVGSGSEFLEVHGPHGLFIQMLQTSTEYGVCTNYTTFNSITN